MEGFGKKKHETKRKSGRRRRKRGCNIIPDILEMRWRGVERIHLAQRMEKWRAVVNAVTNHRVL
jgi:hypothetical protein